LNISPPDSDQVAKAWVARGIEEFKDGEWVAEMSLLHSRLAHWEAEQKAKDDLVRQDDLKGVAKLKERFARIPPVKAKAPLSFRGRGGVQEFETKSIGTC
jgi:hypothetical protein